MRDVTAHLEDMSRKAQDMKADLLFSNLVEDLPNGNGADHVILACGLLDQVAAHMRLASRAIRSG